MPFVTPEQAARLRAEGVQVWDLPTSPPDGLTHYAASPAHLLCHPSSPGNKRGSSDWARVTCPECLRMGKRTGRQENGVRKVVMPDLEKPRNQETADAPANVDS